MLTYLQTEFRRFERERNEWEIERSELKGKIAVLEGSQRAMENMKLDLSRRVKMLESALKQESPALPPPVEKLSKAFRPRSREILKRFLDLCSYLKEADTLLNAATTTLDSSRTVRSQETQKANKPSDQS